MYRGKFQSKKKNYFLCCSANEEACAAKLRCTVEKYIAEGKSIDPNYGKLKKKFRRGDQVIAREKGGKWKAGVIISSNPLRVKVDGISGNYLWDEVKFIFDDKKEEIKSYKNKYIGVIYDLKRKAFRGSIRRNGKSCYFCFDVEEKNCAIKLNYLAKNFIAQGENINPNYGKLRTESSIDYIQLNKEHIDNQKNQYDANNEIENSEAFTQSPFVKKEYIYNQNKSDDKHEEIENGVSYNPYAYVKKEYIEKHQQNKAEDNTNKEFHTWEENLRANFRFTESIIANFALYGCTKESEWMDLTDEDLSDMGVVKLFFPSVAPTLSYSN